MSRALLSAASLLCSVALCSVALWGCVVHPEPYDYKAYFEHTPRSILVLPPMNESLEVEASEIHLSTITQPLAERGYYVYPVAVVELLMRENGLPTAWEMHEVSLAKIEEIIGADAVLYLTIEDWGTSYQVINSSSTVALRGRLVDVDTGILLWEGRAKMQQNSGGGGDPLSLVISALATHVASSINDPAEKLSRQANYGLVAKPEHGLLYGPRHPDYQASRNFLREQMAAREAEKSDAGN